MTILDGHKFCFLSTKMVLLRFSLYVLIVQNKKVIIWKNLKMKTSKGFVKKVVYFTISLLQEHHNRIVLLRERTNLFKRWQEPC
ncbi:hypothetical protein CR513_47295, partial [Mucuna pruriens]